MSRFDELAGLLGKPFTLATLSFAAFLVGTVLHLPEGVRLPKFLESGRMIESLDARVTRREYDHLVSNAVDVIENQSSGFSPQMRTELASDVGRATGATVDSLRPRLLVANQELYGEYGRLSAEASFRINVSIPLAALAMTAGAYTETWIGVAGTVGAVWLCFLGLRKRREAVSVIERSVVAEVIPHPISSIQDRFSS